MGIISGSYAAADYVIYNTMPYWKGMKIIVDIILWGLAFLGVLITSLAKPIISLAGGGTEKGIYFVKIIGLVISIISMLVLYKLGRLI